MKIMSILYSIAYTIQKRTLQTVVKISFSTISTLLNRPKKWGKKNGTLSVWHSMTRKSIQKFYLSKSQKMTARDWVSPTLTLWFLAFSDLGFNAMTTVSLYLFWNFRLFIFGWNSHVIVLCRQCSYLKMGILKSPLCPFYERPI